MKKSLKKNRELIAGTLFLAIILVLCISGCSSGNKKTAAFQITFSSLSINESAVTEYGAYLVKNIPELVIDGKAPVLSSILMGEVKNDPEAGVFSDPMLGMAGIMRMAAVVSTGEMDVFIADMDNAARNARGGMFLSLEEIYTSDELKNLESRLLSFDILKTDTAEPEPTGEKTPLCGINITGNEQMRKIFGNQEIGVFIVANTKNLELAKKVMNSLI